MTAYASRFAKLYDLFHGDKPYDAEAAFVDKVLRAEADGPSDRLLDVACGTGQHAARLASRGWTVLAVDASNDMLEIAKGRAGAAPVTFAQADMRSLDLGETGFNAAICLFDSIGYAVTNDAIGNALLGIRKHLRPGALFMVEFWHAAAMIRAFEPLRVRNWDIPGGSIVRTSRTTLDTEHGLAHVRYDVDVHKSDGRYETWSEEHINRYFLVQEMSLFLQNAGFEPIRFLSGLGDQPTIDANTWHVVALARVPGSKR